MYKWGENYIPIIAFIATLTALFGAIMDITYRYTDAYSLHIIAVICYCITILGASIFASWCIGYYTGKLIGLIVKLFD